MEDDLTRDPFTEDEGKKIRARIDSIDKMPFSSEKVYAMGSAIRDATTLVRNHRQKIKALRELEKTLEQERQAAKILTVVWVVCAAMWLGELDYAIPGMVMLAVGAVFASIGVYRGIRHQKRRVLRWLDWLTVVALLVMVFEISADAWEMF